MKKLLILVFIITLITTSYVNAEDNEDEEAMYLNKGVIFFGADTGSNNKESFDYYLNDNITKGAELYTAGWASFEPEEGKYDWSYIDEVINMYKGSGKKLCIRIPVADNSPFITPDWIFTKYNVRRIIAREAFTDFELEEKNGFEITGSITDNINLSGKGLTGEGVILKTAPIQSAYGYMVGFDYRAKTNSNIIVSYVDKNNNTKVLANINAKAGSSSSKEINIDKDITKNKGVIIWTIEDGQVAIDNVAYGDMMSQPGKANLTFPNYFDPIFYEKYTNFITAFKDNYKDEKTIAMIVTGGFGRWDEPTLTGAVFETAQLDNKLIKQQWKAYGYTDKGYADYMKKCGEMFTDTFKDTNIQILAHVIAFDLPGDTTTVNWNRILESKDNNYILKTNGLSSRWCDWPSEDNEICWLYDRYKYAPNIKLALEEGGQVNNTTSEVMGHHLSTLNRALMHNTDYFWIYDADLSDINVSKYAHYANEQAGNALFTRMFTRFGEFLYRSPLVNQTYKHHDATNGTYTYNQEKLNYGEYNGQKYIATTSEESEIKVSIDDRQEYNGMYGTTITVEYLDEGNDTFKIIAMAPDGKTYDAKYEIIDVEKENSMKWKEITVPFNEWLNYKKNNGRDIPYEIIIDDNGDGIEKVSNIQVDYVPAREWKELLINQEPYAAKREELSDRSLSFNINNDDGNKKLSAIEVAVSRIDTFGKCNVSGKLYGKINGEEKLLAEKNLYMPAEKDWLRLPIANITDNITDLKLKLTGTLGKSYVWVNDNGEAAIKALYYDGEVIEDECYDVVKNSESCFEALKPFFALKIQGKGKINVEITKYLYDDKWSEPIFCKVINTDELDTINIEPQTAGIYKIKTSKNTKIKPIYLKRLKEANEPCRYYIGKLNKEWETNGQWEPKLNLKGIEQNNEGGITALLNGKNPELQTTNILNIDAEKYNIFHMVIKNETACSYAKVYWSTEKEPEFSEARCAYIPIVPNDSRYREYSWPIGQEENYKGLIKSLKINPVWGNTTTGKISIKTMDMRDYYVDNNKPFEKLNIDDVKTECKFLLVNKEIETNINENVIKNINVRSLSIPKKNYMWLGLIGLFIVFAIFFTLKVKRSFPQ